MTAPVAAVILHKEKIAVEAFRRVGAVAPDHAIVAILLGLLLIGVIAIGPS